MSTPTPDTTAHEQRGWQSGLRCQPDCRHHFNEPFRSAYGNGYDDAVAYRKREGIDFWTAKAAMVVRLTKAL